MKNVKSTLLTFLLTILISSSLQAQPANDYAGKWTRNNELSSAGEHISINSIPAGVEVKQLAASLIVTTTSRNAKGEVTTLTDTLNTEGAPTERITNSGLYRTATLKWDDDKKGFSVVYVYKDRTGNVIRSSKEVWSMNSHGQLQIVLDMPYNDTNLHFIEVFDHQ